MKTALMILLALLAVAVCGTVIYAGTAYVICGEPIEDIRKIVRRIRKRSWE